MTNLLLLLSMVFLSYTNLTLFLSSGKMLNLIGFLCCFISAILRLKIWSMDRRDMKKFIMNKKISTYYQRLKIRK